MKSNLLRFASLIWIFVVIQGCGGEDPPKPVVKTPEQIATESLTGTGLQTWTVAGGGSVTKTGTVVTSQYAEFQLVLSAGTTKSYTTQNNKDLFDASGNWSFVGTNFDKINLTGSKPASGREISITQTGDNLRLEFVVPLPGGRILGTQAIAGAYVFNLKKK
jgi:hypothetical protein